MILARRGGAGDGDDADVVLLAEGLGGGGEFGGGGARLHQIMETLEAVELPAGVHGFGDAVGKQHQPVGGGELEVRGGEDRVRQHS